MKGEKALMVVEKVKKDSLKKYFRKFIWKYQRSENSKRITEVILSVYLEGVNISMRDRKIAEHVITLL